jgi:hypothetical protein
MKNFKTFLTPDEIFQYIGNLWRSDIFKNSHYSKNGYINTLITKLSQTPRIFFDMHHEQMEMVHFCSWFHAIQHRYHYKNDILHDLYYHHEFYHLITMEYSDKYSFESWKNKMDTNEFWASLESEVFIYFYMPELRKQSFKETLWVDQFLDNPEYASLFNKFFNFKDSKTNDLINKIAFFRNKCSYEPVSDLDKQIFNYSISGNEWAKIWDINKSWNNVETEMFNYLNLIKINPKLAIESHLNWLKNLQEMDEHNVAFSFEAIKYSEIHRKLFKSSYIPIN